MSPASDAAFDLVAFDLDNVLYDFEPARRRAFLAARLGVDAEWLQATLWDSDFERAAEAGAYPSGAAYLAEFNARLGRAIDVATWIDARRAAMAPRPGMLALVGAVASRKRVAVLTNNGMLVQETLDRLTPELWALLGEHVHASARLGARKPDVVVFERLAARYACATSRTLFVDDDPEYVAGARAAGMHALQFVGEAALARELRALGLVA